MHSAARPMPEAPAPRGLACRLARDRAGHHIHGIAKVSSTQRLSTDERPLHGGTVAFEDAGMVAAVEPTERLQTRH